MKKIVAILLIGLVAFWYVCLCGARALEDPRG